MTARRWRSLLAALVLASLLGCGADGGVGGTGISAISGNVTLEEGTGTGGRTDVEGIAVGIRGTSLSTSTNRLGWFELSGEFDGHVTVEFTERDGTINQIGVEVPSGGELSLRNIRLAQGQALAERIDVDFEAVVVAHAVCDGPLGTLEVSDRNSRNAFPVLVNGATRYESSRGCPEEPTCADLLFQRTLRVSGAQGNGVIQADRVRLIRCRPPGTGR
jgi:hypothetical protein